MWLYDHLAGSVHGRDRVLECWTTLTAIAATVPRIMVGPLVLNVANRPAGTLAVMAATLQELSGGRLLLGIGAGGGRDTPYVAEQEALGREVPGDARRRAEVADQVMTLKAVWRGHHGDADGFLRPEPFPPIVVGGFGAKMAALAGAVGDGVNLPGASAARAARGRAVLPRRGWRRPRPLPRDSLGTPEPSRVGPPRGARRPPRRCLRRSTVRASRLASAGCPPSQMSAPSRRVSARCSAWAFCAATPPPLSIRQVWRGATSNRRVSSRC